MATGGPRQGTKFVDQPQALVCPICQRIFQDPVISIVCGHTFCRLCIESMVASGNPCPLDNIMCDSGQLVINRAVIGQIDDLLIYCRHGIVSLDPGGLNYERDETGCQEIIKLGQRHGHESVCGYAVVRCPLGGDECGKIRQKDLDTHKATCSNITCPYVDFGCSFKGSKELVIEHKANCIYHDESQLLAVTMKELKIVKTQNQDLQQSLAKTIKSVEKLISEKQTMSSQLEHQALTITTLTSRMEKLETEMEGFKAVRLRRNTSITPSTVTGHSHTVPSLSPAVLPHYHEGNTTPIYQRRSLADPRRWSTDSMSSGTSLTVLPEAQRGHFVWKMPFTVKCIGTFRGHKGTIWSLVTTGDCLFSGSSDGTIKVWDIADLRRGCLKTIEAHKEATMFLAVGRGILYSTGTDLSLKSWQLDSLAELGRVETAHEGIVSAMICTKDYVITSSFASIKFWDPLTLNEVHSIGSKQGLSHWVRAMAHDKRKDILYSGSHNKLHVWKVGGTFDLINEMGMSYGAIYSLAVTKKYLIVGTHNQNIQIYNITTLGHVSTLTGHIGSVTVLKVTESAAGVYMFSGSSDTIVQVWDLENMLPIQALQRHEKAVQSVAIWYDTVLTGSEDEEIKVRKCCGQLLVSCFLFDLGF